MLSGLRPPADGWVHGYPEIHSPPPRGRPAGRGRGSRGPANQVTATGYRRARRLVTLHADVLWVWRMGKRYQPLESSQHTLNRLPHGVGMVGTHPMSHCDTETQCVRQRHPPRSTRTTRCDADRHPSELPTRTRMHATPRCVSHHTCACACSPQPSALCNAQPRLATCGGCAGTALHCGSVAGSDHCNGATSTAAAAPYHCSAACRLAGR